MDAKKDLPPEILHYSGRKRKLKQNYGERELISGLTVDLFKVRLKKIKWRHSATSDLPEVTHSGCMESLDLRPHFLPLPANSSNLTLEGETFPLPPPGGPSPIPLSQLEFPHSLTYPHRLPRKGICKHRGYVNELNLFLCLANC